MPSSRLNRRARTIFILGLIGVVPCVGQAAAPQAAAPASDRPFAVAYWTAIGAASLGVALDAYTTRASIGPGKRCNAEVQSPALYGRVPTPARTLFVMGAQLGAGVFVSREVRRHARGKIARRLTLLLASANAVHFAGAIHNERFCR